jgi:hypothetical protein
MFLTTSKHYFFIKFAMLQKKNFLLGKRRCEVKICLVLLPSGVATMLTLCKFPRGCQERKNLREATLSNYFEDGI